MTAAPPEQCYRLIGHSSQPEFAFDTALQLRLRGKFSAFALRCPFVDVCRHACRIAGRGRSNGDSFVACLSAAPQGFRQRVYNKGRDTGILDRCYTWTSADSVYFSRSQKSAKLNHDEFPASRNSRSVRPQRVLRALSPPPPRSLAPRHASSIQGVPKCNKELDLFFFRQRAGSSGQKDFKAQHLKKNLLAFVNPKVPTAPRTYNEGRNAPQAFELKSVQPNRPEVF